MRQVARVDREKEIWAIALWVEKHRGADAPRYIAEQIGRQVLRGDEAGIVKWKNIARRYAELGGSSGAKTI